jgi:hypothetical protein
VESFIEVKHFKFLLRTLSLRLVKIGKYKKTKEVGSFDGHFMNRFRNSTG